MAVGFSLHAPAETVFCYEQAGRHSAVLAVKMSATAMFSIVDAAKACSRVPAVDVVTEPNASVGRIAKGTSPPGRTTALIARYWR